MRALTVLVLVGDEIANLGVVLEVVVGGDGPRGIGEAGRSRHIGDALADMPDLALVAQARQILLTGSERHSSAPLSRAAGRLSRR